MLLSGHDGANTSWRRGQIYWPTLDTRKQTTKATREELLRRCRYLQANSGITRRLLGGLSSLIGHLMPSPVTADQEWNQLALAAFMRRSMTERVFDLAGKLNYISAQHYLTTARLRDGDALTILTEGETKGARFAFREAQQIRQPADPKDGWQDGVFVDRHGRHAAYWLAHPGEEEKGVAFLPDQVIYTASYDNDTIGQVRGVTALAHAVNHITDIREITASMKHAIKVASLVGLKKTTKDNSPTTGGLVGAARRKAAGTTTGGSTGPTTWEEVMASGQIPHLNPNEDLDVIHDDRPSPNAIAFADWIIRDISWGVNVPPEILWQMAGMNGVAVRYVMGEVRQFVRNQLRHNAAWCRRVWTYTIAKELKAGRLRPCRDPEWWQVDWIPQADITIDKGRDGTLEMNLIDAGMGTWNDWYQSTGGAYWKPKIVQRIDEVAFAKAECAARGLDYREVFPVRQGTAAPATSTTSTTEPPHPDDTPDPAPGDPEES